MRALKALAHHLKKMGLIGEILGNLTAGFILFILLGALEQVKALAPLVRYLYAPSSLFFTNLITIFLIIFAILKISLNEKEPEVIFAEKIIFRKVKFGSRTQKLTHRFALSPKIGIKNDVEIFDTRMTLCYMHCRQAEGGSRKYIERHGVEEFTTTADYVETVHRYSFFSEDLSYRVLKPISEAQGSPNHDRIIIVLTGFYGKKARKFIRKHEFSFSDIKFADQTPKVVEYQYQKDQLTQKFNWDNFHLVTYLSEGETSQRIEELRQLLNEIYIEPEPEITENEMSQRMNEMSQRMDELMQMLSQIRPDDPEK
jgi:hypothetical protein